MVEREKERKRKSIERKGSGVAAEEWEDRDLRGLALEPELADADVSFEVGNEPEVVAELVDAVSVRQAEAGIPRDEVAWIEGDEDESWRIVVARID
jgi:hypothetical protein